MYNKLNSRSLRERGAEREKSLEAKAYFAPNYFSIEQLYSQCRQIHDIYRLAPRTLLEVGVGNGLVSAYLRNGGVDVTTVDINSHLNPDICCSVLDLPSRTCGRHFDLISCCEVLEHMPFPQFEDSIRIFRDLSPQLYLTLPSHARTFGFGGLIRLPKLDRTVNWFLDLPKGGAIIPEHYWEIGHTRQTRKAVVTKILRKYYGNVTIGRYALNPYHVVFVARVL